MKKILLAPSIPSAERIHENALLRSLEVHKTTAKKLGKLPLQKTKYSKFSKNRYMRFEEPEEFLLPFIEAKKGPANNLATDKNLSQVTDFITQNNNEPYDKIKQLSLISRVLSTEGKRNYKAQNAYNRQASILNVKFHTHQKSISEDQSFKQPIMSKSKGLIIMHKAMENESSVKITENEEKNKNCIYELKLYNTNNTELGIFPLQVSPSGKSVKLQDSDKKSEKLSKLKEYFLKMQSLYDISKIVSRSQSPSPQKPFYFENFKQAADFSSNQKLKNAKVLPNSLGTLAQNVQNSLVITGTSSMPFDNKNFSIAALTAKIKLLQTNELQEKTNGTYELYKKCVPFGKHKKILSETIVKTSKKAKAKFIENLLIEISEKNLDLSKITHTVDLFMTTSGNILIKPKNFNNKSEISNPENAAEIITEENVLRNYQTLNLQSSQLKSKTPIRQPPILRVLNNSKEAALKMLESLSTPRKISNLGKAQTTARGLKIEESQKSRMAITRKRNRKNNTLDSEDLFDLKTQIINDGKKCEAGIKIIHKDFTHLKEHPINKIIRGINKFIELTFKNKETTYDIPRILKIAKILNIQITKDCLNSQALKSRELSYPIKEKILKRFWQVINSENNVILSTNLTPPGALTNSSPANDVNTQLEKQKIQYKFCVCRGNNPLLVKSILKRRSWWIPTDRRDESLNLLWTQWCRPKFVQSLKSHLSNPEIEPGVKNIYPAELKICNHLEQQFHLSNKKAMFINLTQYYKSLGESPFDTLPLTFHIRKGWADPEFYKFVEYFKICDEERKSHLKTMRKAKNVWIIKPGENSNRGHGIQISNSLEEIKEIVKSHDKNEKRTFIIQKYIEKPLLISKRKFDIRMYGMLTSINGLLKGYFYEEGYIRTSSKEYSLKSLSNKAIHLTNDAVQQKEEDYGKFESGNKLSFGDFQKYLDQTYASLHIDYMRDILPQIRKIITDTFRAVYSIIDPYKRYHTFEIFGYDFMIDADFKVYLIEINTNPCLEESSPLLGRIISYMLDTAFK